MDFATLLKSAEADFASETMKTPWAMFLGYATACFVVSIASGNYSQVDKLWSIVPTTYVWYYAVLSGGDARLLLMAMVTSLWSVRLTFNFARRGGYEWPPWKGEEDYRWAHVRGHRWMQADENPVRWQLFNLIFICYYQMFLLMMLGMPAHIAFNHQDQKLTAVDWALSGLFLLLLLFETKADQEQYDFQTEKYRKINSKLRLGLMEKDGFVSTGLWSLCRHPNYFAEQVMWITIYAYTLPLEGFNWSGLGALLLVTLFTPSAMLSEGITLSKYPAYAKYQAAKPFFFPLYGRSYQSGK